MRDRLTILIDQFKAAANSDARRNQCFTGTTDALFMTGSSQLIPGDQSRQADRGHGCQHYTNYGESFAIHVPIAFVTSFNLRSRH